MPNEPIKIEAIDAKFVQAIRVWTKFLENPKPKNWNDKTYAAERFFIDELKLDRPPLWANDPNVTRIVEKAFGAIGMFNVDWKNPASVTTRTVRQLENHIKIAEQYLGVSIDRGEALNFERGGKPRDVHQYDSIDEILEKAKAKGAQKEAGNTAPPAPEYDYLKLKDEHAYGNLKLSPYDQPNAPLSGLDGLAGVTEINSRPGDQNNLGTSSDGTRDPINVDPRSQNGPDGISKEPSDKEEHHEDPHEDHPAKGR